jgi:hypothetical protein
MALIQIHDGSTDFHAKELLSSSKYLCKVCTAINAWILGIALRRHSIYSLWLIHHEAWR